MKNEPNVHGKIAMELETDLKNALCECEHISDLVETGQMLEIMALVLHIKRGYDSPVTEFLKKHEKYLGKPFGDIASTREELSSILNEIFDEYRALLDEN